MFTYNREELSNDLFHLRFLIQDTEEAGHFFEDEELTFALEQEVNIYRTAANLCRMIAAKLAKTPSLDDATVKFDTEKAATHYMKLAQSYEAKADDADGSLTNGESGGMAFPTIGNGCEDLPAFTRGLHFT